MPKGVYPRHKGAEDALQDAFKHAHYTFPTLTMRQAHILLQCIEMGMMAQVDADGIRVTSDEWINLIKTIIDVRK